MRTLQLVAATVDALIFVAFVLVGRSSHRETDAYALGGMLGTVTPFWAGWFVSAAVQRTYAAPTFASMNGAVARTFRSWVPAWALALAVRSAAERRIVPVTFAAIAFGFNLVLLLTWHAGLAALFGDRDGHSGRT